MSVLSAFTTQLTNLSNNLSDLYPNDADLQFSKTTINLLKSTNPRQLQRIFNSYIPKYKEQIMSKNETFLIKCDFVSNDLDKDSQSDYANSIMNNLKKYWSIMDEESKENIWKYLQVLLVLNDKCNSDVNNNVVSSY